MPWTRFIVRRGTNKLIRIITERNIQPQLI